MHTVKSEDNILTNMVVNTFGLVKGNKIKDDIQYVANAHMKRKGYIIN